MTPPAASAHPERDGLVAAVDCGTNSIKVLVGHVRDGGRLDVVLRDSRVVRLGQGVDETGMLGRVSWWPYVDWAEGWERGVPPGGAEGHSTVISLQFVYALERAGRYTGNLTREDLKFDSPYNTYRYAGLPPGPIAAPGAASLEAAANPADVPYLYFVSRNDGSHAFATTLDEHNKNVHQYQVLYFREKRQTR